MSEIEIPHIISLVIFSADGNYCLCTDKSSSIKFPRKQVFGESDWINEVVTLADQIYVQIDDPQCVKVFSISIPCLDQPIKHLVFQTVTPKPTFSFVKDLKWVETAQIMESGVFEVPYLKDALGSGDAFELILEEQFFLSQSEFEPFEDSRISVEAQRLLLKAFLAASWPRFVLDSTTFVSFCSSLFPNMRNEALWKRLFRAADVEDSKSVTFREIVLLLAACSSETPDSEARGRYIFRYYDEGRKGYWNRSDLKVFIKDLMDLRTIPSSEQLVREQADRAYNLFKAAPNSNIGIDAFLKSLRKSRIHGTSELLRLDLGTRHGRPLNQHEAHMTAIDVNVYHLRDDRIKIRPLTDYHMEAPAAALLSDSHELPAIKQLLSALKYFEMSVPGTDEKPDKPPFSWGTSEMALFGEALISLCQQLVEKLKSGPRCLKISSPVYVFGDIHGNYRSLMDMTKAMNWTPDLLPAKMLLLGDFVDRGPEGVEIVAYLFAHKCRSFDKVHLVRGNHEEQEIQKKYTFHSECLEKFGKSQGKLVFIAINAVFECLPVAAIVDEKVFCVHGGIPPPEQLRDRSLKDAIEGIPCPLYDVEAESSLAWSLMWNDPLLNEASGAIDDDLEQELKSNDGFAWNFRRRTGFLFNEHAVTSFLERHQLSHLVRAHEMKAEGISVHFGGKLISVFSSANYCENKNCAAFLLIGSERFQIFQSVN